MISLTCRDVSVKFLPTLLAVFPAQGEMGAYNDMAAGRYIDTSSGPLYPVFLMFMRLFSAKEAGFKAFFPHAQEYSDYREAALSWDADQKCFHGILLKAAGRKYPVGSSFKVGSQVIDRFVFSFVLLPHLPDRPNLRK